MLLIQILNFSSDNKSCNNTNTNFKMNISQYSEPENRDYHKTFKYY